MVEVLDDTFIKCIYRFKNFRNTVSPCWAAVSLPWQAGARETQEWDMPLLGQARCAEADPGPSALTQEQGSSSPGQG